jgi:hypothetical protein
MRFLVALLCLLSRASLADQPSPPQQQPPPQRRVTNGPPSPEMMKHMLANPWVVEFIGMMGKWSRIVGYPSKEACEAAIPTLPKGQGGDGHCVYIDWKRGRMLGSQDPAWTGKHAGELSEFAGELNAANPVNPNTQKIHWAAEFLRADGKYERTVMFLSLEDCEAGLANAMSKTQSPPASQGHCIYLNDNGQYVGSKDPAWARIRASGGIIAR